MVSAGVLPPVPQIPTLSHQTRNRANNSYSVTTYKTFVREPIVEFPSLLEARTQEQTSFIRLINTANKSPLTSMKWRPKQIPLHLPATVSRVWRRHLLKHWRSREMINIGGHESPIWKLKHQSWINKAEGWRQDNGWWRLDWNLFCFFLRMAWIRYEMSVFPTASLRTSCLSSWNWFSTCIYFGRLLWNFGYPTKRFLHVPLHEELFYAKSARATSKLMGGRYWHPYTQSYCWKGQAWVKIDMPLSSHWRLRVLDRGFWKAMES